MNAFSFKVFDANLTSGASWSAHTVQLFALTAGCGYVYSSSNDGGIRVWTPKGEKVKELPPTGGDVGVLHIFGNNVYAGDEAGNVSFCGILMPIYQLNDSSLLSLA